MYYEEETNIKDKKECQIIGFGSFEDKESGDKMLRILIGINSTSDRYYGLMVAPAVFLNYSERLENDLKYAVDNKNIKCFYTTTDNIITGKTKVDNIFIEKN